MLNLFYALLDTAATETSSSNNPPSGFAGFFSRYGMLILLGVFFVLMIVISGRQRRKQEKEINEKLNALKVGDKIETIGRIIGTVIEVNEEENTLVVQTGNEQNVGYVKIDKMAVYRVINDYVEGNSEMQVGEETVQNNDSSVEPFAEEEAENTEAVVETNTESGAETTEGENN